MVLYCERAARLYSDVEYLLSGVNYFFRLTTIISPEQRQLLSGAGDSPPLFAFLVS